CCYTEGKFNVARFAPAAPTRGRMQDTIIKAVEKMPAFPKSVHQVITLTSDINCSQKQLVEVIKNDPVFTLKILKLVNSPFFGLMKEVTSINQASVYLGLNTLKNVALGLAAIGCLPGKNKAGFDMGAFWLHSLAVASATKLLGQQLGASRDEAGDFFAAGLLHDVGKVVLALHAPEEFKRALDLAAEGRALHQAEQEALGLDHAEVGGLLARHWNLPGRLTQAIRSHHAAAPGDDSLCQCVWAANQVAKRAGHGQAGDGRVEALPEAVAGRLGGGVDDLVARLDGLPAEVERARSFIQVGGAA
ncbi:MAG: HDOD domain-containing protein, partial [Desulfovibrionaceae bacterium]